MVFIVTDGSTGLCAQLQCAMFVRFRSFWEAKVMITVKLWCLLSGQQHEAYVTDFAYGILMSVASQCAMYTFWQSPSPMWHCTQWCSTTFPHTHHSPQVTHRTNSGSRCERLRNAELNSGSRCERRTNSGSRCERLRDVCVDHLELSLTPQPNKAYRRVPRKSVSSVDALSLMRRSKLCNDLRMRRSTVGSGSLSSDARQCVSSSVGPPLGPFEDPVIARPSPPTTCLSRGRIRNSDFFGLTSLLALTDVSVGPAVAFISPAPAVLLRPSRIFSANTRRGSYPPSCQTHFQNFTAIICDWHCSR